MFEELRGNCGLYFFSNENWKMEIVKKIARLIENFDTAANCVTFANVSISKTVLAIMGLKQE